MKLSLYASASLVAGALLLASSFPLVRNTWAAGSAHQDNTTSGQSTDRQAQSQATPRKHIAGVKYQDRVAGDNPDGIAGQSGQGSTQRKDGSIVHSDYPKSADRSSAHATETLRAPSKANTGENPLYEGGGNSGTNPLFESGKQQSAGALNVQPYKDPEDMTTRYRPGNNKTTRNSIAVDHAGGNGVQRMAGSHTGNGATGMAVNEQGHSTVGQRHGRH